MKTNKKPIHRPQMRPIAVMIAAFTSILAGGILSVEASTTAAVTVTFDTTHYAPPISQLINGISEEMSATGISNGNYNATGYFFAATNTQLVQLFKNVGFTSMRIGGDSADGTGQSTVTPAWTNDVDTFFSFAKACGLQVIWTLDYKTGNSSVDATMANYLWNTYNTNVFCLAIGNEPNEYPGFNFQTWLTGWQNFAGAVVSAVPTVDLIGNDVNGNTNPFVNFANAEVGRDNVSNLSFHYEPDGGAGTADDYSLCESMLAQDVDNAKYPSIKDIFNNVAYHDNMGYGFTEFNPNVANGDPNATENTYGVALFALDALHWWANNGATDIHFHSGLGGGPNGSFHGAFYYDQNGILQAYPVLYGSAAYQVGSYGKSIYMTSITGTNNVDLTAYATGQFGSDGHCTNLFVTLINKSFGGSGNPNGQATNATVEIIPTGMTTANPAVHAMWLVQNQGYVTATNGVTLGGASIDGSGPWTGQWTDLGIMQSQYGHWKQNVTNLTAVILEFSAPNN